MHVGHTRNVPARSSQAGDKARSHRVGSRWHDYRDCTRRVFSGLDHWCGPCNYDVHLEANQLLCQRGEVVHVACRPAVFDGNGLSLDPAEIP
jgi:hypothetical protein